MRNRQGSAYSPYYLLEKQVSYPVFAAPMQSEPDKIFGIQLTWMGVGRFKPKRI